MSLLSLANKRLNPLTYALGLLPNSGRLLMLGLAGVVSLLLVLFLGSALTTLEERVGDLGWTLNAEDSLEQRITVVAIDEKSLAEVGPWPWSRSQMANLVSAISSAGAQIQLHDIVYAEARPGDEAFLAALQSAKGAVLAQVPALQSDQSVRTGLLTHPLSSISCNPAATGMQFISTQSFVAPNAGLASIPKGHITPIVASDGGIRKVPAFICVDDRPYPALALSALLQATLSENWSATVSAGESLLGPAQILRLESYPGLDIPLDAEGNMRISYSSLPSNYRAISAVDLLNGSVEPGILENTWALVGVTAFGQGDIVPTPFSGATPGVELQARILGSLLDVNMPYTPRAANGLLGFLSLIFAVLLFGLASAQGRWSAYGLPAASVAFPLVALALHIQLLGGAAIWLGWVFPALYSLFAAGLLLLLEQSRIRSEHGRVFANLNSYLPRDVAKEIAFNLPSSSINAKRCDVTLLSADLRNFSAFGEARPPEESAALLHVFFVRATEIVEAHGGQIQEFKGDSLLAVWEGDHSNSAQRAIQAAKAMQVSIDKELLPQHPPAGLEPLALGIGIEQGPVLRGSIGPAHRRSHTMLGDSVAITLRIQEMTAELAQPVLIGECAARHLRDHKLESQGSYLLKGLITPHTLFALPFTASSGRDKSKQPKLKVVAGSGRQATR